MDTPGGGGNREARHVVRRRVERDVAPFRNRERIVRGFGVVGKERSHLLGGFEEELRLLVPQPVRVIHRRLGLDRHQRVVGGVHAFIGEEALVGRDQRDVELHSDAMTCTLGSPSIQAQLESRLQTFG